MLPGLILAIPALLWGLWHAPWKQLHQRQERQHLFFASILLLALFWQLQIEIRDELLLHPIAMNVVTMMFGAPLALLSGSGALLLTHLFNQQPWSVLPFELVTMVLVPVAVVSLLLKLIHRIPDSNLFFYLFGAAFFGAVPTLLAVGVSSWLYLLWIDNAGLLALFEEYAYLLLLMMFPEGFINCAVATVVTVLRPDLMKTFDEEKYLDDK
ncbi:MAG: hypothetical protein AseanaTS_19630 [Candidatus Pelagadaptatus aseana]